MLKQPATEPQEPIWSAQQWKDWRDQMRSDTPIFLETWDHHGRVYKNPKDRKFMRVFVLGLSAS